ncbi:hypothetical protein MXB_3682, partial [Myxobolus squamalis]
LCISFPTTEYDECNNDRIRTETYQFAIQRNTSDFRGKTVLDVGTGTGLLAFFAIYAGAKKVYAIEASNMADHAKSLVRTNNLDDKITVIHSKLEDVKMFPTIADFWIVPFSDEIVYSESFYGINLTSVADKALDEYFSQPIVDTFDSKIFISVPKVNRFNFLTVTELDFKENTVYLSTAPDRPLTHWYQIRLLLLQPLIVQAGDVIKGTLFMIANKKQSYDIVIDVHVAGAEYTRSYGKYDLKNCYLRCYNPAGFQQSIIYEPTPNGCSFT